MTAITGTGSHEGQVFVKAATATKHAGRGASHAMTERNTPACGTNLNQPGVWIGEVSDNPRDATCARCRTALGLTNRTIPNFDDLSAQFCTRLGL